MAAHSDTEVLVDQLKGVVLVSDPKQVKTDGVTSPGSKGAVDAGDLALAQGPEFVATVQPYLGQPVTMKWTGRTWRSCPEQLTRHTSITRIPESRQTCERRSRENFPGG